MGTFRDDMVPTPTRKNTSMFNSESPGVEFIKLLDPGTGLVYWPQNWPQAIQVDIQLGIQTLKSM